MSSSTTQINSFTISALVLAWVVIVVSGFWWFQYKDLNHFATKSSVVFFEGDQFGDQIREFARDYKQDNKTTVVHFWDAECGCNRFNEPHVKSLIDKYASNDIKFLIVAKIADKASEKKILKKAKSIFDHSAVIGIIPEYKFQLTSMPSTPSVAVLNKSQQLVYFGPYSVGAVCNVKNGAFVEKTLSNLMDGKNKRQINVLATGCFCEWNNKGQLT